MIKAILFPVDGPPRVVRLRDESDGGKLLQSLYAAIGCDLVEAVHLCRGVDLVCDEEGMLVDEPQIARGFGDIGLKLAGNVIAIGVDTDRGEWRSLSHREALAALGSVAWAAKLVHLPDSLTLNAIADDFKIGG